jgi:hypothetical protein
MTTHVNLMTERAKFTAAASRIGETWAAAIGVLLLLMLPLGGWLWQRHGVVIRQHDSLEARYEPIRRMAGANRSVSAQAAELVNREQLPLTLSRRQPVTALLGAVADAVAETEGAVFVDGIHYAKQPNGGSDDGVAPRRFSLDVTAAANYDISQFVGVLRQPPFTAVKIQSTAPGPDEGPRRQTYVLECEF